MSVTSNRAWLLFMMGFRGSYGGDDEFRSRSGSLEMMSHSVLRSTPNISHDTLVDSPDSAMSSPTAMMQEMNGVEPLSTSAKSLIQRAFGGYHAKYGQSSTSAQVYDTAWGSMIAKTSSEGEKQWLFPECFYYLLRMQSDEDGGWGAHETTQTAGILDTAAALLALLRHAAEPLQIRDVSPDELKCRITKATTSLRSQLAAWDDVAATNHISVEVIVPALLGYLADEDKALTFEFVCRDELSAMKAQKLARFRPESLYGERPSSVIHSLEAFVGIIDFDRVKHHLFQGSMMASPSSTAAYLMYASAWDQEAEAYLRHVIQFGTGHGDGSIPGTFPTTYFEYSWTIATLLKAGFTKSDLECPELDGIAGVLTKAFKDEGGIIGFAPRAADVDDTAKGLLALSLLGHNVSAGPMIKVFELENHFTTFGTERDPSFTSNCHVLLSLLHQPDVSRYSSQILKTVEFLVRFWWDSDGRIKDKWHLSQLYPTMLLVEAFTDLLRLLDKTVSGLLNAELQYKVSICLFQAVLRTLLEQGDDGSWDGLPEQTSYAVLALAEARHVCLFADMQSPLQYAISRGVTFLRTCGMSFRRQDHNWVSKTAYRVTLVAEAYILAALKVCHAPEVTSLGMVGSKLEFSGISPGKLEGYMKLVRRTPLFESVPEWRIRASLIESALFVPLLRARRLDVFARDDNKGVSEDTYVEMIPFTWVGCNNLKRTFASTSFLFDMMVLSLLGYQMDEFIETVAGPAFAENIGDLHKLIDRFVGTGQHDQSKHRTTNGITNEINGGEKVQLPEPREISTPMSLFVAHVLGHPSVLKASTWDRENLRRELSSFIHAHAAQVEDNARFARQHPVTATICDYTNPGRPFFSWVRTTAADHVACAYSLAFAFCLMSDSLSIQGDLFATVQEKYLAAASSRHLTTICRMYNDFGSVARDTRERNVNSVHFPEFSNAGGANFEHRKKSLTALAEYEHYCLDYTLDQLEQAAVAAQPKLGRRKMDLFRFFCRVTDMYDQLYVVRDLSSRIKQGAR